MFRLRALHPHWSDHDLQNVALANMRAGLLPITPPKATPRVRLERPRKSDPHRLQKVIIQMAMAMTGRTSQQIGPAIRRRALEFALHVVRLQ